MLLVLSHLVSTRKYSLRLDDRVETGIGELKVFYLPDNVLEKIVGVQVKM